MSFTEIQIIIILLCSGKSALVGLSSHALLYNDKANGYKNQHIMISER